jgi:hypothetical protein
MKVRSHDVIQLMEVAFPASSYVLSLLNTATGSSLVDTKRIVQVAGRVQTTVVITSFLSVKGIRETFEEK